MSTMASQILKFVDFTKIQRNIFTSNKIIINYISKATLSQKNTIIAEVAYNKPSKRKIKQTLKPWIVLALSNSMRMKNKLHKQFCKATNPDMEKQPH